MEKADTLLNDILDSGPSPGTLFLLLSRLKLEGDLNRVIEECRKALDIYPEDLYLRGLLAETYFDSGLIVQAGEELDKVIPRIEALVSSYRLHAEILINQGREKEALESLKICLAHRPGDKDALRLLEGLGPLDETASVPAPAMEEEPGKAYPSEEVDLTDIATSTLAEIFFDQGQINRAIETYEKVIEGNPDDPAVIQRIEELRDMIKRDHIETDKDSESLRQKKTRMIAVLEAWLAAIREKSGSDAGI